MQTQSIIDPQSVKFLSRGLVLVLSAPFPDVLPWQSKKYAQRKIRKEANWSVHVCVDERNARVKYNHKYYKYSNSIHFTVGCGSKTTWNRTFCWKMSLLAPNNAQKPGQRWLLSSWDFKGTQWHQAGKLSVAKLYAVTLWCKCLFWFSQRLGLAVVCRAAIPVRLCEFCHHFLYFFSRTKCSKIKEGKMTHHKKWLIIKNNFLFSWRDQEKRK